MQEILLESKGDIAVLTLNNGITNAISGKMVHDLSQTVKHVGNEYRGAIIAGGKKFFSIGFNLPELLDFNRTQMADFFYQFNQVAFELYTLRIPTVCIMSGHAVAGGNIIALTSDYRYASLEDKLIGLNEIKLGLPVPYLAGLILSQIISGRHARDMLYSGVLMPMGRAKEIGLVDDIFSQEDLLDKANLKILEILENYGPSFTEIKENRLEDVRIRYQENFKTKHDILLDLWFHGPVQALLKEASKKF